MNYEPVTSIENPTLAHFRHFSSPFTNLPIHLSRNLYKSALFIQNKPNLLESQMYLTFYLQMAYENICNWTLGENKPNSNPIYQRIKLIQGLYLQRIMKKNAAKGYEKQSQYKPNFFKCQNERKYLYHKGLSKFYPAGGPKKQTQTNPILKISVLNLVKLNKILTTYEISF